MTNGKTVLITGASGNLGHKLREHLEGRYALRLLDIDPGGDAAIQQADFSIWDEGWAGQFNGVDTVVHMAADPTAQQTWAEVIGPNMDGLIHVFTAAARAGVKRLVYASSNHVMGGYKALEQPERLTTDIPPLPGTHYVMM
jgi:nucleoside-diphosphate-sugar epimerase